MHEDKFKLRESYGWTYLILCIYQRINPQVSMYILIFTLAMLPSLSAVIDCKLACRTCSQKQDHPEKLEVYCAMCTECKLRRRYKMSATFSTAVYTTTTRTTTRSTTRSTTRTTKVTPWPDRQSSQLLKGYEHNSVPAVREIDEELNQEEDDCPTPPPCSSEEEVVVMKKHKKIPLMMTTTKMTTTTTRTTATTSTTTTTTEPPKCPPIEDHCRKKEQMSAPWMPCLPCMPMCMTPCPLQPQQQDLQLLTTTSEAPQTTTDYVYVYVGVPKSLDMIN